MKYIHCAVYTDQYRLIDFEALHSNDIKYNRIA